MASHDRSIGQLVTAALDDVRAIVQHEKALAKAEISRAAKAGGVGAGLLAAALATIGLATVFLLVAAAEAIVAAGLSRWAAFLIIGGALVLLAVVLGAVGASMLKKVRGPQRTVEQGKGTVEDVKGAFSHDGDSHDSHDLDVVKETVKVAATVSATGATVSRGD